MSIMSPQTGLPTRPTATLGPSSVPTLRGLRKCSRVFSLYWVDFMSGASRSDWSRGDLGLVQRREHPQAGDHAGQHGHDAVHVAVLAEAPEGELQGAVRLFVQKPAGDERVRGLERLGAAG